MAINFVPQTDYCCCSQCNLRHGRLGVGWCGCLLDRSGLDSVPFMWGWVCGRLLELCSGLESVCLPSCGGVLVGDFARTKLFFTRLVLQVAKAMRANCFLQGKIACKAGAKRALCFSNDFARKKLTSKTTWYTRAGSEILKLCFFLACREEQKLLLYCDVHEFDQITRFNLSLLKLFGVCAGVFQKNKQTPRNLHFFKIPQGSPGLAPPPILLALKPSKTIKSATAPWSSAWKLKKPGEGCHPTCFFFQKRVEAVGRSLVWRSLVWHKKQTSKDKRLPKKTMKFHEFRVGENIFFMWKFSCLDDWWMQRATNPQL